MAKNPSKLVAIYERGDIVSARRLAEQILTGTPSESDAATARDILERTRFQPFVWRYAAIAVAVMALLMGLGAVRNQG